MGFISEKLTRFSKWTRDDINELARIALRMLRIRVGEGLLMRNYANAISLGIDKGALGIPAWKFARIVNLGPYEAEDLTGAMYWVREVAPMTPEIISAQVKELDLPSPSKRRSMRRSTLTNVIGQTHLQWAVPTEWLFTEMGYWGPAVNLAEVDLPTNCQHFAVEPFYAAIPVNPIVDNTTPEGEITDSDDARYLAGPIVKIWKHSTLQGNPFWAFSLMRPRLIEEWFMQAYDLDDDDCPDPIRWAKRVSLILHDEDGAP